MRRWILFALVAVLGADASNMSAQVVARRPGSPSVERAWLGISYESVRGRPGDARATLVILEVVDGSPAQRAGIQVGDTLVNINGLRASDELLQSLASSLSVGDTVKIRMRRGGFGDTPLSRRWCHLFFCHESLSAG